ncbi:MAG: T9SS type A sorting domain-containing protein [Chitinophagales bacterium]|nr:T9SS type A sorting domain-containing protein [Chitinophagales bacterium]
MKTILFFIAFALLAFRSGAQIDPSTPWTWMKGDHSIDIMGIYGTKGVPSSINKPGSRTSAITWSDKSGNLWMFGGMGNSNSELGYLNDLWKFDIGTNKWTWVKGDSSVQQYSVYGTQGNSNAANKPGATYASVSWTDMNGNLWMFGGFGYTDNSFGFLNALWMYNPATNNWTWIKGDNTIDVKGSYGVKGNEHNNNKPGARYGSNTWTDANGYLWLYGGYGYNSSETGLLNDLWRYNPSTNKWTWISGDNAIERTAVFGTKGVSSSGNKPGARYVSTSWADADGNFWLFGGYGYDAINGGNLSDLWKYNPTTNLWTWISGHNTINQAPVYGIQGTGSISNTPGARYISSSWTDPNGELWLFGGYGYDGSNIEGYLNDFWKFSPFTNTWTWVKGDNKIDQKGIYGIQGQPSLTNKTGARQGSVSWTDQTGNLWLFGGYGYDDSTSGILNDLWKINSYNVVLPVTLLQFNGTLANGQTQLQWVTEQETGFSHYSIQRSFDGLQFSTIGKVDARGAATRNEYRFTDALHSNHTAGRIYYRLQLTDKDGKNSYSKVIFFNQAQTGSDFRVFPNPAVNNVTVSLSLEKSGNVRLTLTDMKGTIVKQMISSLPAGKSSLTMDCSQLSSAMYILTLQTTDGQLLQEKLIIRR